MSGAPFLPPFTETIAPDIRLARVLRALCARKARRREPLMDLIGRFSKQDVIDRIGRLHRTLRSESLLHRAPTEAAPSSPGPARRRRQSGEVLSAILQAFLDASSPLYLSDIHEAVRAQLDKDVTISSVKMALKRDVESSSPIFARVGRGLYFLRR